MSTTLSTKKLGFTASENFKESFFEASPTIGYIFIGNHLAYPNETSPTTLTDSVFEEKAIWDNMFAAKKITGNDVELVIPKVSWTGSTKYKQFDDVVAVEDLLTGDNTLNVKPMYVVTTNKDVYKCLSNNSSANSTVEPTGDYVSSNGNVATADGYLWKYMYHIPTSSKFTSDEWVPAPTSTNELDYGVDKIGVVDGELTTIVVTNTGSGYYENNVDVLAVFTSSCSTLTLANTTNVAANMSISGTGITPGSFISVVDTPNNKITLSTPTTGSGGGGTTANQAALKTRIFVDGDGTGVDAEATVNGTGFITSVTVSTIGINFSRANALAFGTGSNATLRTILSPKFGHAFNPAKELGSNNVMATVRIGEIDSTENGKISSNTTFRQFGIFVNPYKYGEANVISSVNANSVVSQTTDVTAVAGSSYSLDEFVYQGSTIDTASAFGFVIDQTATVIKITNVRGTFESGVALIGANSGINRLVVSSSTPEYEPYSGDVIYVENATKTTRSAGQAENIKLIVRF